MKGHVLTYFRLAIWRETIFCLHKQVAAVNRESAKRALHSDGRMVLGDSDPLRTHRDFKGEALTELSLELPVLNPAVAWAPLFVAQGPNVVISLRLVGR